MIGENGDVQFIKLCITISFQKHFLKWCVSEMLSVPNQLQDFT